MFIVVQSEFKAMGVLDTNIRSVLESSILTKINFKFGTYRINGNEYGIVARAIRSGDIGCVYDASFGDMQMKYHTEWSASNGVVDRKNTIYSGNRNFPTINHKAVVVHEATHALQDYHKRKRILAIQDEGASYLAQFLYVYSHNKGKITYTNRSFDRLAKICFRVAKRLHDLQSTSNIVTRQEQMNINRAVANLNFNGKKPYSKLGKRGSPHYDGF